MFVGVVALPQTCPVRVASSGEAWGLNHRVLDLVSAVSTKNFYQAFNHTLHLIADYFYLCR